MDKNEKYEKIAKLFFKKLILLEKDITVFQEKISEGNIRLYLEIYDIFPLLDFAEIINVNDKKGSELYEDIKKLIEENDTRQLEQEINIVLKKYVE